MKKIEKELCQNCSKEASVVNDHNQREMISHPEEEFEPGRYVFGNLLRRTGLPRI